MKNVSTRQREHESSPERYRVWTEPSALVTTTKRVSVVYYLSRNGHLEHPHFMEVLLSSPDGLYLKDVIRRLNLLRGYGIGSSYSWSSKRSYKNGFVWHDLSEDDYIHPVHGHEYVLKGSEILNGCKSEEDSDSSLIMSVGKNQHWSSGRPHERKVCKTKSAGEVGVSTQTKESDNEKQVVEVEGSPPVVDSSPETLESLMKADKRVMVMVELETTNTNLKTKSNEEDMQSGGLKASSLLMQLITCGSFSFRHSGATTTDDRYRHGVKLITNEHKAEESSHDEHHMSYEKVSLEDEEYFSGSVIEDKTNQMNNADRVSQNELELAGDGV